MNTLEQKFARDIYTIVSAYGQQNPEDSKERKQYGSMAHRLPVLVHSAGLVQALAFVNDRGKPPHKELLDHLVQVLEDCDDVDMLLERSRSDDFKEYRYLTQRVSIALSWFKRFAQSVLKVEPGMDED